MENRQVKSLNINGKKTFIFHRAFPIDMAGFAVHVDCILSKPNVWMGFDKSGKTSVNGFLESDFLEKFSSRETVECRGNNREVCERVVATSHDSGVPGYHQT